MIVDHRQHQPVVDRYLALVAARTRARVRLRVRVGVGTAGLGSRRLRRGELVERLEAVRAQTGTVRRERRRLRTSLRAQEVERLVVGLDRYSNTTTTWTTCR